MGFFGSHKHNHPLPQALACYHKLCACPCCYYKNMVYTNPKLLPLSLCLSQHVLLSEKQFPQLY